MLLDWPHRPIRYSTMRIERWRVRYRRFYERHGYKPWRYYPGRHRWTALPPDVRAHG
jgi:hypothetical protein